MSKEGSVGLASSIGTADQDRSAKLFQSAVHWLTLASLFIVVMTPLMYLAGRAYHDGWYGALNLDQSMFPLDTAGMLTEGAIAMGNGFGKLTTATLDFAFHHWFVFLAAVVCGGLIWAAFVSLTEYLGDRAGRMRPVNTKKLAQWWLFRSALPRMLLFLVIGAVFYEVVFGVTFGFAAMTQPFVILGKHEAKKAAANDFRKSPMVIVRSPKGDVQLREIGCGPQFCALWGEGHASYAPVSAISWSDSPPPEM